MNEEDAIHAQEDTRARFSDLPLSTPILQAVQNAGYETPSPIQAQAIPPLLEGSDLLGVAQTGTGKTAAFSLPLLSRIDESVKGPQILCLAPTRELALQVAEAIEGYAENLPKLRVVAVYGGTGYGEQIREFKRGAQVVVGMGGFTSLPPLYAGKKLGMVTALHDSNALPGKSNRLGARWCSKVLLGL